MDRNIGDPLNKAYEAYRNISIENENAKKLLQEKTEQFHQYTQQLEKKIEHQEKEIAELKAQLKLIKHDSGEVKCCKTTHRKQETERLSPSVQWPSNSSTSHRTNYILKESVDFMPMHHNPVPGVSGIKSEDVLDTLQEIQGTFQRIKSLAKKQKDHLKRIHKGNDAASAEQQFSMPIQCTDILGEQVEEPFSSSPQPKADKSVTSGALASREEGDFMNDVKFPPPADSEYEFLHSAPDRSVPLPLLRKDLSEPISTVLEESYSSLSVSTRASHLLPASVPHEGVRGPQQPLWSPDLDPAAESEPSSTGSAHCTFCKATVPSDLMYSHLNSHFQGKAND